MLLAMTNARKLKLSITTLVLGAAITVAGIARWVAETGDAQRAETADRYRFAVNGGGTVHVGSDHKLAILLLIVGVGVMFVSLVVSTSVPRFKRTPVDTAAGWGDAPNSRS